MSGRSCLNLLGFQAIEVPRERRGVFGHKKLQKNVSELGTVNSLRHRNSKWRGFGKEALGGSDRRITRGNRG